MARNKLPKNSRSAPSRRETRPLSALLSQILVAFTVELDNQFERLMNEAGHTGGRLSLVVWSNLIRFVLDDSITIRELAAQSLAEQTAIKFQLGCLERWGFVVLNERAKTGGIPEARGRHEAVGGLRDGWGSGRGLSGNWTVRLTAKGAKAKEIWPPLFDAIEERWRQRFGDDEIKDLRDALQAIVAQIDIELPHGLMNVWQRKQPFPARLTKEVSELSLPALFSQVLVAFAMEFERESPAPLWLCANTIRVLGEQPIRQSEIARLTGSSPETSGSGWQLKPYIVVESGRATGRGKLIRLSARGLEVQKNYHQLALAIEKRWEQRFGKDPTRALRAALESILDAEQGESLLLAEGLVPPNGTVRAGDTAPALGRRDVGSAAKQRARHLVAQTESFVSDPAAALPHYPLWDMNRGFGP
jgi:DNA-binding MarR family transcriptional regulator